jgi:hypothetical protein
MRQLLWVASSFLQLTFLGLPFDAGLVATLELGLVALFFAADLGLAAAAFAFAALPPVV